VTPAVQKLYTLPLTLVLKCAVTHPWQQYSSCSSCS